MISLDDKNVENFAIITGKHLCHSLFFNNVAGFRPATLLKKSLRRRCFPANFAKFLRTPFLTEHLRWLPLFMTLKFISLWSMNEINGFIKIVYTGTLMATDEQ